MSALPPAEIYRALARRVREQARTTTERYAQRALQKTAELYDKLADQIDEQTGSAAREVMPRGQPIR